MYNHDARRVMDYVHSYGPASQPFPDPTFKIGTKEQWDEDFSEPGSGDNSETSDRSKYIEREKDIQDHNLGFSEASAAFNKGNVKNVKVKNLAPALGGESSAVIRNISEIGINGSFGTTTARKYVFGPDGYHKEMEYFTTAGHRFFKEKKKSKKIEIVRKRPKYSKSLSRFLSN